MSKMMIIGSCLLLVLAISIVYVSAEESDDKIVNVTIGEILDSPDEFLEKQVSFNGTITSMCGSGCWFIIADDTGDMYVTTRANNFVIPQSMGKFATVTGTVFKKYDAYVLGSSVVIGDTEYS